MKLNQIWDTNLETEIKEICYDSRKVSEGSLFVAIRGYRTDGHQYIRQAQEKGAAAILCEEAAEGVTIPQICVPDSRLALALAADRFYGHPTENMQVFGVTGTNGKTTVTYLLKSILEAAGKKVGLIGTNQNMIGQKILPSEHTTPESSDLSALLAQMKEEGCDCVIMEVSSHSLYLHRVATLRYTVAGFTNLTQDHLDFHGTMENYFAAKAMLFTMCENAVINSDDEYGKRLCELAACPVTAYGTESGSLLAEDISLYADGISFRIGEEKFALGIPGGFTVYNALCAIGMAKAAGIDTSVIRLGISSAQGVKGRLEVVPVPGNYTVLIDYAHTPDGLYNLLQAARGFASGRVVVLFGCGGDRDKKKRPQMGRIAGELADLCIVTSDNPRSENPREIICDILEGMKESVAEYVVIESRRDAIAYALRQAQPDDLILLAGKGHETYQIFADGTIHFDEREVIAEVLAEEE